MTEYLIMQAELFLRLLLAAICGGIVGYERKSRGKGAGIRTHLVVAVASALMMIISKYGFSDVSSIVTDGITDLRLDPSRLAAQIVSGVGFLGAGMIYINGKTPHGLTTAAGIWATSGIGMAIGSGMYIMGFLSTLLIVAAQMLLHRNWRFLKVSREEVLTVTIEDSKDAIAYLQEILLKNDIQIENLSIRKNNDSYMELDIGIINIQEFNTVELMSVIEETEYIKEIKISGDIPIKK